MSTTSTDDDSSTDTNREADCGHTVPRGDTFLSGEFRICEDCYLDADREWFGLDAYPNVLQSRTSTVIEGRGSSTTTSSVSLVATTQDRKALYHDERNGTFWYVVPLHSDYHDTSDANEAPIRETHSDATYGAPPDFSRDSFCTMPNGDHLALLEHADAPRNIRRWVEQHDDELREVRDRYQPVDHRPPTADD